MIKDEQYYLIFFEEMKRRMEEKEKKYQDMWKSTNLPKTRVRLIVKFFDWLCLSINNGELDIDIIDIANQAMLLWLVKNK